jgi:hypothetical protein
VSVIGAAANVSKNEDHSVFRKWVPLLGRLPTPSLSGKDSRPPGNPKSQKGLAPNFWKNNSGQHFENIVRVTGGRELGQPRGNQLCLMVTLNL